MMKFSISILGLVCVVLTGVSRRYTISSLQAEITKTAFYQLKCGPPVPNEKLSVHNNCIEWLIYICMCVCVCACVRVLKMGFKSVICIFCCSVHVIRKH